MFVNWYEKVKEFHKAFGLQYSDVQVAVDKKLALYKLQLVEEELAELTEAICKEDVIEQADALADLAYVILNYHAMFGVRPSGYLKDWQIKTEVTPLTADDSMYLSDMYRHVAGYCQFLAYGDELGQQYQLYSFLALIVKVSAKMGIDIEKVFDEVHRSNMTKIGGYIDDNGKYRKPDTFEPPRLKEVIYGTV